MFLRKTKKNRINPGKRQYREHQEQSAFVKWMSLQHPKIVCFAIPNAGNRTVQQAMRMQKEGLVAGVPDVFIALPIPPYGGLFLEFKFGKNKASDNQKVMMERLLQSGYEGQTVYSVEEAIGAFKKYLRGQ